MGWSGPLLLLEPDKMEWQPTNLSDLSWETFLICLSFLYEEELK